MSYNKHTWANGNVVGAVDLNRIEQGIEDAGSGQVLVVNAVYDENSQIITLDKTWQEIYDAFPFVIEYFNVNGIESKHVFEGIEIQDGDYWVYGKHTYVTYSSSDYPTNDNIK